MRASGQYGAVGGRIRQLYRYGRRATELVVPVEEAAALPGAEILDDRGGVALVRVPSRAVEQRWHVETTALWQGERVMVDRVSDAAEGGDSNGEVRVSTFSQRFGQAHGWEGSTYDGGWWATVPLGELYDVREAETEAPAGGRLDYEGAR